jgi:hypothetical protein
MKQTIKWTGLVLVAAAVGLALVFAFAAVTRVQTPVVVAQRAIAQATPYPFDYGSPSSRQDGYGGWGMMGPGMMMGGRYRADTGDYSNNGTPLTLDQAIQAANQYLAAYGNTDLTLTEVMEFSDNFYAEVEEENSGIHAFELLIDRYSGAVYPEPGPNMMWNTKYGHMGGSRMTLAPGAHLPRAQVPGSAGVGGWGGWQAGPMSVTPEKALELAQEWLDQYLPGTSAAEKADAFYGYYTIHTLKDGQVTGMLSVNDYTGEVWYHTWHGDFITMKELED